MGYLSQEQKRFFKERGYLVLPGFKERAACEVLLERTKELIEGFDGGSHRVAFSTDDEAEVKRNAYFMDSGTRISFFFEEEALDAQGNLLCEKAAAINKLGHAMHALDPVFSRFSRDPRMAAICADLGMEQPLLIQSMCICKQPRIGGAVNAHQDATYLYTTPESTLGMWFALEDATRENGCLWVLPGGHLGGLGQRYVRGAGYDSQLVPVTDVNWPEDGFVPVEVEVGSLVLIDGYLPHQSQPNRSHRSRYAYTLHLLDGACNYEPGNWIRFPQTQPPRGF